MSGVDKAGKPVVAHEVPKPKTELSAAPPPPESTPPKMGGDEVRVPPKGKLGEGVQLFEPKEKVLYTSPDGDVQLHATSDGKGSSVGIRIKF